MKYFLAILLSLCAPVFAQTCTTTLSANSTPSQIAAAVSNAANGDTICLPSGNYGAVSFTNISRTGHVTLRSAPGARAQMAPTFSNSRFIRLKRMTLRDVQVLACSANIAIVANTWVTNAAGIVVSEHGYGCSAEDKNILIDGNTFTSVTPAWSEGKIGLVSARGVTITNNLCKGQITGNGGDCIQTGGSLANIMIGPGNIFRNIRQAPCDATPGVPHCDAIQFVGDCSSCTITGNWFDNVEVVLQHHDATVPVVFTDNLITTAVQMWVYSEPGNANDSRIEHNTFYNVNTGVVVWGANGSGESDTTGLIGRNNLLLGANVNATCNTPSCSFSYNMCTSPGACSFSRNAIIGTPTFVGGSPLSISTWAGWKLAAGSVGQNAASDGKDVGTNYFKPGRSVNSTRP